MKDDYSFKDTLVLQKYWSFFGEHNGWNFIREMNVDDSLISATLIESLLGSALPLRLKTNKISVVNKYVVNLDKPHRFRLSLVDSLKKKKPAINEIIPIISFRYSTEPEKQGAGGISIPGKTGYTIFYPSLAVHLGIFKNGELIYLSNAYYQEKFTRIEGAPAQDTLDPNIYPRLASLPRNSKEVVAFNISAEMIDSLVTTALKDYVERLK
jgi:hypothetical protein